MNENKPRRRAQAQAAQKKARKSGLSRFVLMVTMMALVAVVSIGGTMAWLQDNTEEVVNTFTGSNIDIILTETNDNDNDPLKNEYQMIPGDEIVKDPKVTVKANSEASYVFVKLTKTDATYPDTVNADVPKTFDDYLTYTVDNSNWTALGDAYPGVYYRTQDATTADTAPMSVLTGDKVYVNNSVTKEMMDALQTEGSTYPKLTIQAFAVQQLGMNNDPVAAWLTLPGNAD